MRRANTSDATVEISRAGSEAVEVEIQDDVTTLREALEKAGVGMPSGSETIWVRGEEATLDDILNDGDTVQIIGKKDGGLKQSFIGEGPLGGGPFD